MQKIGGLWQKVSELPNNIIKYGLYHNYKSDFKGNYILGIAIESNNRSVPLEMDIGHTVFDVDTNVENPIVKSCKKIWSMSINRS